MHLWEYDVHDRLRRGVPWLRHCRIVIVVRIVQNRAPSELSYLLDSETDVGRFIDSWVEQNPGMYVGGSSMPIIDLTDWQWDTIPVTYP